MANSALRLRAILDIEDKDEKHVAGDEWLFEGPGKELWLWDRLQVKLVAMQGADQDW